MKHMKPIIQDKGFKILIVDDAPINIQIVASVLKNAGYRISFAQDGKTALEKAHENDLDLILLDVLMPELDGFEVCRKLKASPTTVNIPVIFLTVKDQTEDVVKGFEVGAVDYVTKPFNSVELLGRVRNHLKLKRIKEDQEQLIAGLKTALEERKQAEAALRESEEKFRVLADTTPTAVMLYQDDHWSYVNRAAETICGYSEKELLTMNFWDFVHPEFKSLIQEHGRKRQQGEETTTRYEFKIITKDGTEKWVDLSGASTTLQGRPAGIISVLDITDRKRSEEALQRSKNQYEALAANIPVGVYLLRTTPAGGFSFEYVSPQMAKILGLSVEGILTDPQIAFQPIHPDESEAFVRLNRERIEAKQSFLWEGRAVVTGTIKWLRIESQPERLDNGDVLWHGVVSDITEQKQAEEALKVSQRQLADIIEFLPDATFVIDKNGKVIAWNHSIENMTEISKAEMVGKDNFEYAVPFYGKRMPILVNLVINPETSIENRYSSFRKEKDILKGVTIVPFLKGKERILSCWATPIYNNEGEIIGAIESLRDITEQKIMEKALSSEHQKLSSILDGSPVSSFVIDGEHRVTAWNVANEFYTGISKEEVLGKFLDLSLLFKDKTQPILADLVLEMTDEEILKRYAYKGVRKSNILPEAFESTGSIWIKGKEHIMAIQATRLRDSTGNVIGAIQCAEDITEQIQVDEELRESEELYRTALESSNDGVAIIQDGRYIYFNQKLLNMLGLNRDDMMVMTMGAKLHPDDRVTVLDYYDKYKKGLPMPDHFVARAFKADGSIIYAEVTPVEVTYKGEKSVLAYFRNITDRKRAEEDQMRFHKLESVGTLAGGIAHDFNNLLAVIQGYIELVKMDIPPENKVHSRLMAAEKSVIQATDLTKRLLTFSKGGEPIKKVSDIGDMIKDVVLRSIGASPVEKKFYLDSDLWPADVDEGQIRQVIRNLAINALEAMHGGGRLTIRVENTTVKTQDKLPLSSGTYIRISMEDTGEGIPKDALPLIFDPYYSTKKRGAEKGMGLGLSVCHSVVSKHNGCITVESEEGKGSTFHVYLPAAVSETSVIKKLPLDERPVAKGRILVMDDEVMVRDMLTDLLMAMGYNVETANDGLAAIDLYIKAGKSQQPYKMVILDLMIPGGLGGKLTMERLLAVDPDVKGIIISAYTDDPIIQNYQQYGFLEALTKPFTLKELQNILEKYL